MTSGRWWVLDHSTGECHSCVGVEPDDRRDKRQAHGHHGSTEGRATALLGATRKCHEGALASAPPLDRSFEPGDDGAERIPEWIR